MAVRSLYHLFSCIIYSIHNSIHSVPFISQIWEFIWDLPQKFAVHIYLLASLNCSQVFYHKPVPVSVLVLISCNLIV